MKDELLQKWLRNELNEDELKSFKASDDYLSYIKILDKAKCFKAPDFNKTVSIGDIKSTIKSRKKKSTTTLIQLVASVAAAVILIFSLYKFAFSEVDTNNVYTQIAKTETIALPDNSKVSLNANSSLLYDKKNWDNSRKLKLDGEALFKVEKGEKFEVDTKYGKIEVLGTIFNVKSRDYTFSVDCYEGSVKVTLNQKSYILNKNNKLVLNNDEVKINASTASLPDWKNNLSIFKSQPLNKVLLEFKNYYKVEFDTSNINTNKIFTGSFSHHNIEIALNSITLPLGLTYQIDGETVFLLNK